MFLIRLKKLKGIDSNHSWSDAPGKSRYWNWRWQK